MTKTLSPTFKLGCIQDEDIKLFRKIFGQIPCPCDTSDITAARLTAEERILSSAWLFDCDLQGKTGYYIYAVLTEEAERGRGYMRTLLSKIDETARKNKKDFLILIPSNQALFDTYTRLGYNERLFISSPAEAKSENDFSFIFPSAHLIPHYVGNLHDLYEMSEKSLSFNNFCYAISTLENAICRKSDNGFAITYKDTDFVFCTDKNSESLLVLTKTHNYALVKKITDFNFIESKNADPLPR